MPRTEGDQNVIKFHEAEEVTVEQALLQYRLVLYRRVFCHEFCQLSGSACLCRLPVFLL